MLDTWQWPLLLDINLDQGGLLDDSLAGDTSSDGSQHDPDPKQQQFRRLSVSEETELPQHLRLSFGSISELPAHELEELLGSGWSDPDNLLTPDLPMPALSQQPSSPTLVATGGNVPASWLPHSASPPAHTSCATPPPPPQLLPLLQMSPRSDTPPAPAAATPLPLTPSRPPSASSLEGTTQLGSSGAAHNSLTHGAWQPQPPQPQPQQTPGSEDSCDGEQQARGRKRRPQRDASPEKLKQLFQTKQEQNRRNQADCRLRKKLKLTEGRKQIVELQQQVDTQEGLVDALTSANASLREALSQASLQDGQGVQASAAALRAAVSEASAAAAAVLAKLGVTEAAALSQQLHGSAADPQAMYQALMRCMQQLVCSGDNARLLHWLLMATRQVSRRIWQLRPSLWASLFGGMDRDGMQQGARRSLPLDLQGGQRADLARALARRDDGLQLAGCRRRQLAAELRAAVGAPADAVSHATLLLTAQKVSEQVPCIRLQAARARHDFVDNVLFEILSPQQAAVLMVAANTGEVNLPDLCRAAIAG